MFRKIETEKIKNLTKKWNSTTERPRIFFNATMCLNEKEQEQN